MAIKEVEICHDVMIDEGSLAEALHNALYYADLLKVDIGDNGLFSACRTPHRNKMFEIAKEIAEGLELS